MTDVSPTYRGLIFDLDGTLIDSAPDIAAAVNTAFAARGWPVQPVAYIEGFIGNGPRRLLLDMMVELGLPHDADTVDEAVAAYIGHYKQQPARHTVFYPHVKEDLAALHAAGFRLGVCTNKPHALTERILDLIGIAPFFGAALGADAVPACKPDPRHLLAVSDALALGPGDYAYIGDTAVDLQTAEAAAVPFFAVPWGSGEHLAVAPGQRLARLADLMAYRPVTTVGGKS